MPLAKGVAECGNCTNTHNFFFSLRPDPPTPLIGYNFPTIHVFSQFLHKKKSYSIHSEIVFMLHFVPVELMMTLVTLL